MEAMILEFLDLREYKDKLTFLQKHREKLDAAFYNAAAVSLDFVECGKSLDQRYDELLRYLRIKMRYETGRR